MDWKISRNENHNDSNEENLALGIAQEDDSNIFELLQNLFHSY